MTIFFVTTRLAFGSKVWLNRHVEKLQQLGITHVIDVRNYPSKKLRKFKTIHLNFKDNARPRPMWFYARALGFYRKALEQPNSKVFVMCLAGRRRSASMTYFLLRTLWEKVEECCPQEQQPPPCQYTQCPAPAPLQIPSLEAKAAG